MLIMYFLAVAVAVAVGSKFQPFILQAAVEAEVEYSPLVLPCLLLTIA
jgi:hypothetical protein